MFLLYLLVGLPFLSNSVGSFSIKSKCVCVYSSFKCLTKSSTSSSPGLKYNYHQNLFENVEKSTYEYSKWTRNEFLSGNLGFAAAEFTSISLSLAESIFSLGLLLPGLLMLRLPRDPDLLVLDMIEGFDCLRWSDFTSAVSQVVVYTVKGPPFLATGVVPDACLDLSICARASYA